MRSVVPLLALQSAPPTAPCGGPLTGAPVWLGQCQALNCNTGDLDTGGMAENNGGHLMPQTTTA